MTDKKYEELLKCTADLVNLVEFTEGSGMNVIYMKETDQFKALKACLPPPPPSRKEIADYFEEFERQACGRNKGLGLSRMLNHAVNELRKDV